MIISPENQKLIDYFSECLTAKRRDFVIEQKENDLAMLGASAVLLRVTWPSSRETGASCLHESY